MMNPLSKETGFFYLMYMKGPGNYYKCWIDGSSSYEFYTQDEILEFASRSNDNELIAAIKRSFHDSSIFIWMVDEGRLERARPVADKSQIKEKLSSITRPEKPLSQNISIGWRT